MQMTYFQFDSFLVAFLDTVTKFPTRSRTRWGAQSTRTWQTSWRPRWKRREVTMWRIQGLYDFLKKMDQRRREYQVKFLYFSLTFWSWDQVEDWELKKEISTSCPKIIQWTTRFIKHRQRGAVSLCFTKEAGSFCSGLHCKGSEQESTAETALGRAVNRKFTVL